MKVLVKTLKGQKFHIQVAGTDTVLCDIMKIISRISINCDTNTWLARFGIVARFGNSSPSSRRNNRFPLIHSKLFLRGKSWKTPRRVNPQISRITTLWCAWCPPDPDQRFGSRWQKLNTQSSCVCSLLLWFIRSFFLFFFSVHVRIFVPCYR